MAVSTIFPFIGTACIALLIAGSLGLGVRANEDKKSDKDTKVAAGTEFKLTAAEIVLAEKPDEVGRYEVTVKPAKEATKVKMPETSWTLGFYPQTAKGGGVGVADSVDGTGLKTMRTVAGNDDEEGGWQADPGDVITYVNGYAVNSVEEALCAVSLAKNKSDVQIVIKDVTTNKLTAFYVTAAKR